MEFLISPEKLKDWYITWGCFCLQVTNKTLLTLAEAIKKISLVITYAPEFGFSCGISGVPWALCRWTVTAVSGIAVRHNSVRRKKDCLSLFLSLEAQAPR